MCVAVAPVRVSYRGRPGLSPVNAALVASGVFAPGDLVLDAGCGEGEESVALALEGLAVVGLDRRVEGLESARRRALANGVGAATWFVEGDARRLDRVFQPATFDAAVDVLLFNNVRYEDGGSRRAAERYLVSLARVLRPGAPASIQWRIDPERAPPSTASLAAELPPRARRLFEPAAPVVTHVPVFPEKRGGRGYAAIGHVVLRRRKEAL